MLTGEVVEHNKYGRGRIVQVQDSKVEVAFADTTKKFTYPDAFENYLRLTEDKATDYVNRQLRARRNTREQERAEQEKRQEKLLLLHKKKRASGHVVLALGEEEWNTIQEEWRVCFGAYLSGKKKGQPRIPDAINMNSVCILTWKKETEPEKNRQIVGLMMPPEDFIGEQCDSGWIPAHEVYRIQWNEEQEPVYFWSLLPEHLRQKQWGRSLIKHVTAKFIKQSLLALESSSGEEKKEKLQEFYQYFVHMNE